MATLLLHWLNDELALHRKVDVLERDLCNGYILAEVLHIHGLESHLERYNDGMELSTRVANLELLDKAMVTAGLGKLAMSNKRKIMMEDRSTILQLLLRMKEFVELKGKKSSLQQQKLQNVSCKVYEPQSPVKDPTRVIQDVEERFIKETVKQLQPKEVKFYKEVNAAVHLRKFPQAQWQAENEQIEHETMVKTKDANESAKSMAALRSRMDEKRAFMKDWDMQHLEKWQHTQRMYIRAEQEDLRLELTLEERRRRFHNAKFAEIEADSRNGVVSFEKNMNRLGLSNSSGPAEASLRAIPASDPGAIAHLDRLEERVRELGFRPSNNIQMMKELRARRTAQLAAEKDRRMRRMKVISDSKRITAVPAESPSAESVNESVVNDGVLDREQVVTVCIFDAFIEANRDALEANYSKLREVGASKRELDTNQLDRLRQERQERVYERSKRVCVSIIDDLVSLSMASTEYQAAHGTEGTMEWKRQWWLDRSRSFSSANIGKEEKIDTKDNQCELQMHTHTFLSLSDNWAAFTELHREGHVKVQPSQKISHKLQSFVQEAIAVPSPDLLETKWSNLDRFKLVAIFSSDERGHRVAREVARDHSFQYVNIEELFEECINFSYDPVKQVDVAASLSHRERELGVFGPKLTALRQKNSVIPESLAVDIVLAALSLSHSVVTHKEEIGNDAVEDTLTSPANDHKSGVLLHNFPRTLEEWKLFEKGMLSIGNLGLSEETKADRLDALDVSITAAPSEYASAINCAIIVSPWDPTSRTPSPATPGLTPSPSATELSASASDRRRSAEPSKRQSVVDPAVARAEAIQEMMQKRRQVEDILTRTSRTIKIDQADMDERVLQELAHLAIDVYTCESFSGQIGVLVECAADTPLPQPLDTARELRRSTMPIRTRIGWMVVAKQLQLSDRVLFDVIMRLRQLEQVQLSHLFQLFRAAFNVLEQTTHSTRAVQHDLDDVLGATAPMCQASLDRARQELCSQAVRIEKILITTEVALGDAVDAQRVVANCFVSQTAVDSPQPARKLLLSWLQLLPLVCLEIKEFVIDTSHALREGFYSQFGFLRATSTHLFPVNVSSAVMKDVLEAAKVLDQCCSDNGIPLLLQPEIARIASQLATPVTSSSDSSEYELNETNVKKGIVDEALLRITAILRWSVKLVETVMLLHATDIGKMRKYIDRDLRKSNITISRIIRQLTVEGSATWPDPKRAFSPTLLRHHQAAFLNPSQIARLIDALTIADSTSRRSKHLTRDAFSGAVVDIARREGFPDVWHDFNNVIRVALAWSRRDSTEVPWRHVVLSLIVSQLGGFPTIETLETLTDQLRLLVQHANGLVEGDAPTITRADFLAGTTLWFENGSLSFDEVKTWKELIFSMYTTDDTAQADVFSMLFAFCGAPTSPVDVRSELSSVLLPRYSRGLARTFTVLTRWTSSSSVKTTRVSSKQLRALLMFAGVTIDETRLANLPAWSRDDASAFLAWCDAYNPVIGEQFTVHDTFAALVDD